MKYLFSPDEYFLGVPMSSLLFRLPCVEGVELLLLLILPLLASLLFNRFNVSFTLLVRGASGAGAGIPEEGVDDTAELTVELEPEM